MQPQDANKEDGFRKTALVPVAQFVTLFPEARLDADIWRQIAAHSVLDLIAGQAVLRRVTARSGYMPLLDFAIDAKGSTATYNPDGLAGMAFKILLPAPLNEEFYARLSVRTAELQAEREAEQLEAELAEKTLQRQRAKLDRLGPHLVKRATNFRLDPNNLLDDDLNETWLCQILTRLDAKEPFDRGELSELAQGPHKYFAAAVHWNMWEVANDQWAAVKSCSLLRRAGERDKALRLSSTIDVAKFGVKTASALLTTRGGSLRDVGRLSEAREHGERALAAYDEAAHPFLLLGAICYQEENYLQGDRFFSQALARGATSRDVEATIREAHHFARISSLSKTG
ncbi:MAG: hypothetical protein EON54_10460 [Alcaligenaceae bacterium]|nr:MAG: hypothetical protein EON54_10460 [Alcaligenaceae bacterium]